MDYNQAHRTVNVPGKVRQHIVQCTIVGEEKREISKLLADFPNEQTVIFYRTNNLIETESNRFKQEGIRHAKIGNLHNMSTGDHHRRVIAKFNSGEVPIILATFGLQWFEAENIDHVINTELPQLKQFHEFEEAMRYVTARGSEKLHATTFFVPSKNEAVAPRLAAFMLNNGHGMPQCLERFTPNFRCALGVEDLGEDKGNKENGDGEKEICQQQPTTMLSPTTLQSEKPPSEKPRSKKSKYSISAPDSHVLFIGNMPNYHNYQRMEMQIREMFHEFGTITEVIVQEMRKRKQFGFVVFDNPHSPAAVVNSRKRFLMNDQVLINVSLKGAVSAADIRPTKGKQVKISIDNLPLGTKNSAIRKLFSQFGTITTILPPEKQRKGTSKARLTFDNAESAFAAAHSCKDGLMYCNQMLTVRLKDAPKDAGRASSLKMAEMEDLHAPMKDAAKPTLIPSPELTSASQMAEICSNDEGQDDSDDLHAMASEMAGHQSPIDVSRDSGCIEQVSSSNDNPNKGCSSGNSDEHGHAGYSDHVNEICNKSSADYGGRRSDDSVHQTERVGHAGARDNYSQHEGHMGSGVGGSYEQCSGGGFNSYKQHNIDSRHRGGGVGDSSDGQDRGSGVAGNYVQQRGGGFSGNSYAQHRGGGNYSQHREDGGNHGYYVHRGGEGGSYSQYHREGVANTSQHGGGQHRGRGVDQSYGQSANRDTVSGRGDWGQ